MGEKKKGPLRVEFDREIKLEFHGARVSSDSGLLIYRELDESLGLTDLAETMLSELRIGKNTQHTLIPMDRDARPCIVDWRDMKIPMMPSDCELTQRFDES